MKIIIPLVLPLLLLFPLPAWSAPASQYWGFWNQSNETSTKTIDHSQWSELLSHYLIIESEGTLFSYNKVSGKDRKLLQNYLNAMTSLDPREYAKKEQKAYWINLYNALTVELILENYPVKSITKIGSWFRFGPWDKTITKVAGQTLTLNDIEHRILRPLWQDKRIHYAVNCASKGCPDLAESVYTGANIESMLETAAKRFINQEKGVVFIDGKLTLSRIYEWYSVDFGSKEALLRHLKRYSSPAMSKKIEQYTGVPVYQYSWSLNQP